MKRFVFSLVMVGAAAGLGRAQDAPPEDKKPAVKQSRDAQGRKVYRIENAVVIEGKIQKPEAYYVLSRSAINYDWDALKKGFIPKMIDSVRQSPF